MKIARTLLVVAALALSSAAHAADDYRALHAKALDLAISGDTKGALQVLQNLKSEKLSENDKDRVELSLGRVLYQIGDFKGAVEEYRKISPGSESWFVALEERAWAYMKMDQPEQALAQLKTLMSPLFKERATSEAYFLTTYAHLRICEFPALFKDLDLFKERFRPKVKEWQASSNAADQAKLKSVQETIQKLNVVEAEAIQRLYMEDETLKTMKGKAPRITKKGDQLSFPIGNDSQEVWLDEVDNYQVHVKGCPSVPVNVTKLGENSK
jgi:tetratricopeptide (TPR) repeat protein